MICMFTHFYDHTLDHKKGRWCVQTWKKGSTTHRFHTEKEQKAFIKYLETLKK